MTIFKSSLEVSNKPVIVIVGPTGSGKTSVSISVAKKINGRVISADSRAIYKNMNIGTAKPALDERDGVIHYGFDLVEPGERFTVADWKKYAEQKIKIVEDEGAIPIVAGGTGLYIDALVYDYSFTQNVKKNCSDRFEMSSKYKIFGIYTTPEELRNRLKKRVDNLFVQDLFNETRLLVNRYGWNNQAMTSNIYKYAWEYMNGLLSLNRAKELCFFEDWHLAKRQITWFKRNNNIQWSSLEKIESAVIKCIHNE